MENDTKCSWKIPHSVLHKAVPTQPSEQKGDRLTFPGCALKRHQDRRVNNDQRPLWREDHHEDDDEVDDDDDDDDDDAAAADDDDDDDDEHEDEDEDDDDDDDDSDNDDYYHDSYFHSDHENCTVIIIHTVFCGHNYALELAAKAEPSMPIHHTSSTHAPYYSCEVHPRNLIAWTLNMISCFKDECTCRWKPC